MVWRLSEEQRLGPIPCHGQRALRQRRVTGKAVSLREGQASLALEKGMATHSSILAGRIPWTEEPGRLQSMGWQRVRHD